MRSLTHAAGLSAALSLFGATAGLAQDATLTARSGGLSVSGRMVSYDGVTYRIETQWGRLTVDAAAVDCKGPGCPDLMRFAPELRIAVEPWLADHLLHPLIQSFAHAEGLTLTADGPTLDLSHDGRTELRLHLLTLPGPAAPLLATEAADAALTVDARGGRLIARLPLTLASAPDAPPGAITIEALRDQRHQGGGWERLGAEARPLVWHNLPHGSSLDEATALALGPLKAEAARASDPESLFQALRRDPWGLAVLPMPLPDGVVAREVRQRCGLLADLSDFAAAAGDHPLLMPVVWVDAGRRLPPVARSFANHLTSPAGQAALAKAGVPAPSAQMRQAMSHAAIRLSNALADRNPEISLADRQAALALLGGAERLAITFRFDARTGALDAASRAMLDSLSAQLASRGQDGRQLLLVGFSDSTAPAAQSLSEGEARARAVADGVRAITPDLPPDTTLRIASLGEALPLACDDTAEGRRVNRRVEVWLTPLR